MPCRKRQTLSENNKHIILSVFFNNLIDSCEKIVIQRRTEKLRDKITKTIGMKNY